MWTDTMTDCTFSVTFLAVVHCRTYTVIDTACVVGSLAAWSAAQRCKAAPGARR
jgi:hypothetical protein